MADVRVHKEYYPFIDVAKGLGVFCVLMVHTARFWVDIQDDFITKFIKTFYMNLLFLASGFVYAKIWNRKVKWVDLFSFKTLNILIPFFVLGLSTILLMDYYATGTISRNPFERLFFEVFNGGFWFLLTLFLCRWIIMMSKLISQSIGIKQDSKNILFVIFQGFLCTLWGGVIVWLASRYDFQIQLFYLSYFFLGILIMIFNLNNYLNRRYFFPIVVVLFIAFFTFNYVNETHYFGRSVLASLFSTIMVWIILQRTRNNIIVKFFRWVGGFSLDVYVLHAFFLIGMIGWIDSIWFLSQPWVIQSIILVAGALIQLMCCFILSKIIRSNTILTKFVLGK